jgi:eukaryotic-like serine/threonine-protein kinase
VIRQREEGKPSTLLSSEEHNALEVYVAGRFRPLLSDDRFWSSPLGRGVAPYRAMAARVLSEHPRVSETELAAASGTLKVFLARHHDNGDVSFAWWEVIVTVISFALMFAVVPAVVSALVIPGGLVLNAMGIAVIGRRGREVSRLRSLWRAVIAWSPILVLLAIYVTFYTLLLTRSAANPDDWSSLSNRLFFWFLDIVSMDWVALSAVAILAVGAGFAILSPARGLQDRIAGTWLVPK